MKAFKIYFLFLLFGMSCHSFAQFYPSSPKKNNDIETLEKLNSMMEKDSENEFKAKQTVMYYRSEIRTEMRDVYRFLKDEQAKDLINRERLLWQMATQNLQYSKNYQTFYRQNYDLLESYKDSMLDYISKLTN